MAQSPRDVEIDEAIAALKQRELEKRGLQTNEAYRLKKANKATRPLHGLVPFGDRIATKTEKRHLEKYQKKRAKFETEWVATANELRADLRRQRADGGSGSGGGVTPKSPRELTTAPSVIDLEAD
eukprot:TRINITY_DN2300_c0_g1_i3.p1 TRINITY_DN2300_c0_g1~~TRINITY_DN2300_c0_g1_i3.p1  ORF type:complete len:125 (-),score=38.39 TRINITY_DN2300_c0_g1_i3:126-500(-)